MDDELKFFLMAMYAMKPDKGTVIFTPQPDGATKWEIAPNCILKEFPIINLHSLGVVAYSEEQARAAGMETLLGKAPPEDGWINHHVTINTVSRTSLERVVELATGDHDVDDDLIVM